MKLAAALAALSVVLAGRAATAAPTAFSTDGEATVYLRGDFRGDFELVYDAQMRVMPENASWSVLNVSLLGGPPPSDAVTIGIFPVAGHVHVFTSFTQRSKTVFRDTGIVCEPRCRIALHGSASALVGSAAGRAVGSWPRFALRAPMPAVQLNAETSAPGDRLDATLSAVRTAAHGRALARPACAFTTRGIEVRFAPDGTLHYAGAYRDDARTAYFSLAEPLAAKETCGASERATLDGSHSR